MEAGDVLYYLGMVGEHLRRSRRAEKTNIYLTLALVEWEPNPVLDASPRGKKAY
jgi:hypothetical protein